MKSSPSPLAKQTKPPAWPGQAKPKTWLRRLSFLLLLCVLCVLCGGNVLLADTASKNPTSDDAVSGTWDGTPGSRYSVVDDHPDSAGADFLTHGTTTAGDLTFGFPAFSIPVGSTVAQVDVIYYDQKSAAQACNIGGRLKVGGNYYNASTHNPANGTWTLRTDTWTTNPKSTAAWTVDDVNGSGGNALQAFGWVSTDASPTIRLASVIVQVTYTLPSSGGPKRVYISAIPSWSISVEVSRERLSIGGRADAITIRGLRLPVRPLVVLQ